MNSYEMKRMKFKESPVSDAVNIVGHKGGRISLNMDLSKSFLAPFALLRIGQREQLPPAPSLPASLSPVYFYLSEQ